MTRPRVSVVVVNWNGRHLLAESLPALAAQEGTDLEVIVVDNASSDGSAEWIRRRWPGVRLVESPRNLGFAAANNAGIAEAGSEWLALLNPDAVPGPRWLATMLDAAHAPPVPGLPRDRLAAVDALGQRGNWSSARRFVIKTPQREFLIGTDASFADIQQMLAK
ncbi:MAG: glycosyltransferase family 2 protein, partial [Anaerolineae bacterium]